MIGRVIGHGGAAARDAIARGLIRIHVTPNALSCAGAIFTALAGFCLAIGACGSFAWRLSVASSDGAWLVLAFVGLLLAAACDMLDGAVARIGKCSTKFGALLDSVLDRFSDFAVYAGIAVAYMRLAQPNITFALLAMISFFNAIMISYTKARAENLIRSCSVGFWQRPERAVAVMIGILAHNIPALLVLQASLPLGTVWARLSHAHKVLSGKAAPMRRPGILARFCIWRAARGTLSYDLVALAVIAWLIFARVEPVDFLRCAGG